MNLIDKMKYAYAHGEEMPLKGHVRLVLEDVRDGTQKVEEGHNLITNAVASILANNWCGLANFSRLFPLKSLYGGCLLFQNPIAATADNYNPPNELDNPLVAHAGNEAPASGWTGKKRGSPVLPEYVETETSIRQVWLWDNTQGNGTISAVSLCPTALGNSGLTPSNDTYSLFSAFGNDSWSGETMNEDIAKRYPFNIAADGKTAQMIYLDGTTFKERTMRHDYLAFGIMRGTQDWQEVAIRTATVRSGANRFIFDDAEYYYIARATSETAMQIDKVSKSTFAVTQADITFDGVSLYTGTISGYPHIWRTFAFDGTYLYYPNTAGTGMLKLNISDNSDYLALDGEILIDKGNLVNNPSGAYQFATPLVISDGLVLGSNYLVNGANVYQMQRASGIAIGGGSNFGQNTMLVLNRVGASAFGQSKQSFFPTYTQGQANVLVSMFLSTIFNLESARVKSTSQTMRLEYTLTEQT